MSDLRCSIIFPDENQGNLIGPSPWDRAGRPEFANTARIPFMQGGRQRLVRIVADRLADGAA
jgi:hypothetical protein